jgi:acyl carrier protein
MTPLLTLHYLTDRQLECRWHTDYPSLAGAKQRGCRRAPDPIHEMEMMHVTDDDIYARLTPIFREVFDDDELKVHPQLTARDVPEWDSMTHIRLVLSVEKAFGTRFAASEIARLENVGELVSLIGRRS